MVVLPAGGKRGAGLSEAHPPDLTPSSEWRPAIWRTVSTMVRCAAGKREYECVVHGAVAARMSLSVVAQMGERPRPRILGSEARSSACVGEGGEGGSQ